jgi:hypothetical protein
MEFLEGNYSQNCTSDVYWGNEIDITHFRNHFAGLRAAASFLSTYVATWGVPYKDFGIPRAAAKINAHSVRNNFIGNILGLPNQQLLHYHTAAYNNDQTQFLYEWGPGQPDGTFIPHGLVPMWFLGEIIPPSGQHMIVGNTYQLLWRQGNWDWFTQTQTWYANPQGAQGHPGDGAPMTLPNSLYLSSKPAFFGSNPWPWVDPSTGKTTALPAKARFDAGTPNNI